MALRRSRVGCTPKKRLRSWADMCWTRYRQRIARSSISSHRMICVPRMRMVGLDFVDITIMRCPSGRGVSRWVRMWGERAGRYLAGGSVCSKGSHRVRLSTKLTFSVVKRHLGLLFCSQFAKATGVRSGRSLHPMPSSSSTAHKYTTSTVILGMGYDLRVFFLEASGEITVKPKSTARDRGLPTNLRYLFFLH